MFDDCNEKKDFMVEWIDNRGKEHKTKLCNKFVSATEAANYIYDNRKTCAEYPYAYWI